MFDADRTLGTNRWPVVKLGAGCRTEIILLSRKFFALTTHWDGHTIPCPGDNCPLCEIAAARGLFFVACMCNSRVSILELGAMSSSHFEQHAKFAAGGMIPGSVFTLSRSGAKKPVRAEFEKQLQNHAEVETFELAQKVMALFKYPCANPSETLEQYEERIRRIAGLRTEQIARRLHKAAEHN